MNELSKGVPALVPMNIVSHHNTSLVPRPSYLLKWQMKAWYTLFAHMPDFNLDSVNLCYFVHICVFITCTSPGVHKGKERSTMIY